MKNPFSSHEEKYKYYNLTRILSKECHYNMIFGERSNGKTYSVEDYALKRFCETGEQLALVRRWREDFIGKRGKAMFDAIVSNGLVEKYSNGEYTKIVYKASMWYLARHDDELDKDILCEKPFCYGFSLASYEHDKSTSYPDITTILFDEFLTRNNYLVDEFVLFANVVSTIVRQRNNVKIFMCGNTVNKYSPYFKEMGLTHINKMKVGDIDVYQYGESSLRVAVEYADGISKKGKPSDLYFAFNNPKLQMITGGAWEIAIYPHCPCKFDKKDILLTYFIIWEAEIFQCEIVNKYNNLFTYIHVKTTPIKNEATDIIYSPEFNHSYNWKRNITKRFSKVEEIIYRFFLSDKVFYQDNEVGEAIRNYLQWCKNGGDVIR